jgi:PAS domain S-box-containing protein
MTHEPGEDESALVDSLSPRERQLLEMATSGLTDQAIANELGISLATVSTYWGRIRIKYGPLGRTEIVARYLRALMNRATVELRASESRMRTVLEALPVGVFLADPAGHPVYVNSAYVAIAGKDEAALKDEGLASLVFPGDRPQADAERESCLSEGRGYVAEHRWTRGEGTLAWVRIHSEAWHDESGIAGRVGVVEDVTQEHEARERQSEAEERYRLLFALAPEAIVSVDEGLNITGFNTSAERMFGYVLDDIVGQPLSTLIPDRFRRDHAGHIQAFGKGTVAAARPMAARSEVRGLRKDGTEFPCEASIVRQVLDGHPHYTAIVRDVSDRFRPAASGDPLDAIPLPAWRIDAQAAMIDGNDTLRSFTGHAHGERFQPIVSEDLPAFLAVLAGGTPVGLRARLLRRDGERRWHRLRAQPERDGWLVVATDVHDLETAAEELRKVKAILGN